MPCNETPQDLSKTWIKTLAWQLILLLNIRPVHSSTVTNVLPALADVAVKAADTQLDTLVCGPNDNLPCICPFLQTPLLTLVGPLFPKIKNFVDRVLGLSFVEVEHLHLLVRLLVPLLLVLAVPVLLPVPPKLGIGHLDLLEEGVEIHFSRCRILRWLPENVLLIFSRETSGNSESSSTESSISV